MSCSCGLQTLVTAQVECTKASHSNLVHIRGHQGMFFIPKQPHAYCFLILNTMFAQMLTESIGNILCFSFVTGKLQITGQFFGWWNSAELQDLLQDFTVSNCLITVHTYSISNYCKICRSVLQVRLGEGLWIYKHFFRYKCIRSLRLCQCCCVLRVKAWHSSA